MKVNENTAISTADILLVPYDAHHVAQYHAWMEDAAIREATASDRLSLHEEYENQRSWRRASDRLTFILCQPVAGAAAGKVMAGEVDRPEAMTAGRSRGGAAKGRGGVVGEVDIMIASAAHRGRGLGTAAVRALLAFVRSNLAAILAEYGPGTSRMEGLVAKINETNKGSIALFARLGFRPCGTVNYFGELEMRLPGFGPDAAVSGAPGGEVEGYRELGYDRSRLPAAERA